MTSDVLYTVCKGRKFHWTPEIAVEGPVNRTELPEGPNNDVGDDDDEAYVLK